MKKKERKKGCKLTHKTNEEKSKKVEIKIKKKEEEEYQQYSFGLSGQ